jgi:uncharacterized protein YecE (DUF72 family)
LSRVPRARIGVSGWSYKSWAPSFYPAGLPARRQLEHVAQVFDTVEVNGSFYSLLSPRTYRSWYEQTPPDFLFAVKGSRFITHNKKMADAEVPLANFFASGVLALGDKLGPFLWQLPAQARFDRERLSSFLALLPRTHAEAAHLARGHDGRVKDPLTRAPSSGRIRHALEARHESFFREEAVRVLRNAGVALVVSDSGSWRRVEELTAGFVYVRLHGSPLTYASRYDDAALDAEAKKIRSWLAGGDPEGSLRVTELAPPRRKAFDVYVYFDNDAQAHAPHDALRLRGRLEQKNFQKSDTRVGSQRSPWGPSGRTRTRRARGARSATTRAP